MATTVAVSSPAPGAGAPAPMSSRPQAAGMPPQQVLRVQYVGVKRDPGGGWAAHVLVDPERRAYRTVGPFPDEHAAALAHDRVAIAHLGDRARANFRAGFHPMEQRFLRLCRTRAGEIDVCALVADVGTYEARYATFLRAVLRLPHWGEYLDAILDFYIGRAAEIGEEALAEEGGDGEKLAARFVEMHRNKATDPRWRAWHLAEVKRRVEEEKERRRRLQLQLQGACGGAGVQPQQQHQVPPS
jgi:hypothetical protein